MPDTVLVSIRCGGHQGDFELPARIPLGDWENLLLDAVRNCFRVFPEPGTVPELTFRGTAIAREWTLEQCGIFDGSTLTLTFRKKGGR